MNKTINQLGRLGKASIKPKKDELYHFGILGMKWGKRNGPPYPLDYSQLSRDERDRAKGRAKREGNLNEAGANRMYYSDQELRDVVNRFKLNKEVDQLLSEGNITKGEKKIKKITKNIRTVGDLFDAIQKAGGNAINTYNKLGLIQARYMGTDFTPINQVKGEKNSKSEEKKKDEAEHSIKMTDELYHFGILGQKWGKRHGPPYPLDSSVSTGKKLKEDSKSKKKPTAKPGLADKIAIRMLNSKMFNKAIEKAYTPDKIKKVVNGKQFKKALTLLDKIRDTKAYSKANDKIDLYKDTKAYQTIIDNLKEYAKNEKVKMTNKDIHDYLIVFNGMEADSTRRLNEQLYQFMLQQQLIQQQFMMQQDMITQQTLMQNQINDMNMQNMQMMSTPGMF